MYWFHLHQPTKLISGFRHASFFAGKLSSPNNLLEFNLKILYPYPHEKLISIISMQISILLRKSLIILTGKKLLKAVIQFSKLIFWLIPFFNIMSNFIPKGAILIDNGDPLSNNKRIKDLTHDKNLVCKKTPQEKYS